MEFLYWKSVSSGKGTSPFNDIPGSLSLLGASDLLYRAREVVPANASMVWRGEGCP